MVCNPFSSFFTQQNALKIHIGSCINSFFYVTAKQDSGVWLCRSLFNHLALSDIWVVSSFYGMNTATANVRALL